MVGHLVVVQISNCAIKCDDRALQKRIYNYIHTAYVVFVDCSITFLNIKLIYIRFTTQLIIIRILLFYKYSIYSGIHMYHVMM